MSLIDQRVLSLSPFAYQQINWNDACEGIYKIILFGIKNDEAVGFSSPSKARIFQQRKSHGYHKVCNLLFRCLFVEGMGIRAIARFTGLNQETVLNILVKAGEFAFGVSQWRNPLTVIGIKRKPRIGNPDLAMATTCHAERTNLSVRIFTRRFTRCTLGYSKKVENLRHAVAIFVCHFNFVRIHSAHNQTPAQAAGLTDHVWKIEEILTETI